jgi:hypothetical protein
MDSSLLRKFLRGDISYILPGHFRTSSSVSIDRVDAIKCIRRVARSRICGGMGPRGCLRDKGVGAIGMMPHATLFEIFWAALECRK